jgi:hypothetical protein
MADQQKSARGGFKDEFAFGMLVVGILGAMVAVPALICHIEEAFGKAPAAVPAAGIKVVLSEDYGVRYAGKKEAGNGDMTFAFGDECWVQHGGTLTVLCGDADGVLVRYTRPKDDAFGSLCPVSVNVYIDAPLWQRLQDEKVWLARTKAAMERLSKTCGK